MTTLNISLPEPLKEFIEAQAAREGFGPVSESLGSIILDIQRRQARQELEASLLDGDRSPAAEMTDADRTALRLRILERSPELRDGG
jgi:antitoxin ParD1/3/4